MPLSESDTRAKLIDPVLHARGWTEDLIRCEETAGAVNIMRKDNTALHLQGCVNNYVLPNGRNNRKQAPLPFP
jgi:type I site-specific restriction endonuclease